MVTDPGSCRIGPANGGNKPADVQQEDSVSKRRQLPVWKNVEKLITLLIGALGPVARLIDAISRLR